MGKHGKGYHCTYCTRRLEAKTSLSRIAATKDHVLPQAHGGRGPMAHTVWCCRQCNSLKGDMMPDDWSEFMRAFPRWWVTFKTGGNAKQALALYRRQSLGPVPLTADLGATGQTSRQGLVLGSEQSAGTACGQFEGLSNA